MLSLYCEMTLRMDYKENTTKKLENVVPSKTGSIRQYANSPFFIKKDENAKKFLKQNPIPDTFWDKPSQ